MIIRRSPLPVTLGGGGTDLPSYYRHHEGFLVSWLPFLALPHKPVYQRAALHFLGGKVLSPDFFIPMNPGVGNNNNLWLKKLPKVVPFAFKACSLPMLCT